MKHADVIVVGLGGMGSATVYQLARRGVKVLGLEQFMPGHNRGSSHGHSRVIRQAYFEHPAYVPLLLRAYELWRQIEQETGDTLLTFLGGPLMTLTGGLMMGPQDSAVVQGSIRSAREHNLPHEVLTAAEVKSRFPVFTPGPDDIALYEKAAGYVRPEAAIRAHLARAIKCGAGLHSNETVVDWTATDGGVTVRTNLDSYHAGHLIVTAGAWASRLLADLRLPLRVTRQTLYWFEPTGGIEPFHPSRFPIYICSLPDGEMYGFPAQVEAGAPPGVKVAYYYRDVPADPDVPDATTPPAHVDAMRAALSERLPALNGRLLQTTTCLYTETPDHHFLIDQHPNCPQVIIASPCSGHGYKFCSVIGEILADMATLGHTAHLTALFSGERLGIQNLKHR